MQTGFSVIYFLYNFSFCLSKIGLNADSDISSPSPPPSESTTFLIWFTAAFAPQKPHFYPQEIPQYFYFLWEMTNCTATRSRNKKACYGKAMIWLISSPKQNLSNKSKKLHIMWPSVYRTTFESTGQKEHLQQTFSPIFLFCLSLKLFFHFCFAFVFLLNFALILLGAGSYHFLLAHHWWFSHIPG